MPLGPKGLDWLKIHTINLTGLKKREPISERLRFANDNIDLILDSADNPLSGQQWWKSSEEPWQTLAACMEIAAAMRSPDPEKYMSGFPIHQDGSCNGLQHYAALGRDVKGAKSVNLMPANAPMDVYSDVLEIVQRELQKDAESGNNMAQLLMGKINRKTIKQTVMTTVYGVTKYGAKLQIFRQLKDSSAIPESLLMPCAVYLAKKVFDSIDEVFTAARKIQNWLTDSAGIISSYCGKPVEWTTPLGLPVIQPYHKEKWATYDYVPVSFTFIAASSA